MPVENWAHVRQWGNSFQNWMADLPEWSIRYRNVARSCVIWGMFAVYSLQPSTSVLWQSLYSENFSSLFYSIRCYDYLKTRLINRNGQLMGPFQNKSWSQVCWPLPAPIIWKTAARMLPSYLMNGKIPMAQKGKTQTCSLVRAASSVLWHSEIVFYYIVSM